MKVRQHSGQQAEEFFVWFVLRQQMLRNLSAIIQRHGPRVVRLQVELRLNQLAAGQIRQIGVLPLKIGHPDVGQPLQTRPEWTFWPAGTPGDAAQFPQIACKKTDDQIRFPEGIRTQDERLAHPRGHRFDAKY